METLTKAVKLPVASVVTELGIDGIVVPSQAIVTLELFKNPEPTTVVDAKPVEGVRTMVDTDSGSGPFMSSTICDRLRA